MMTRRRKRRKSVIRNMRLAARSGMGFVGLLFVKTTGGGLMRQEKYMKMRKPSILDRPFVKNVQILVTNLAWK